MSLIKAHAELHYLLAENIMWEGSVNLITYLCPDLFTLFTPGECGVVCDLSISVK